MFPGLQHSALPILRLLPNPFSRALQLFPFRFLPIKKPHTQGLDRFRVIHYTEDRISDHSSTFIDDPSHIKMKQIVFKIRYFHFFHYFNYHKFTSSIVPSLLDPLVPLSLHMIDFANSPREKQQRKILNVHDSDQDYLIPNDFRHCFHMCYEQNFDFVKSKENNPKSFENTYCFHIQ